MTKRLIFEPHISSTIFRTASIRFNNRLRCNWLLSTTKATSLASKNTGKDPAVNLVSFFLNKFSSVTTNGYPPNNSFTQPKGGKTKVPRLNLSAITTTTTKFQVTNLPSNNSTNKKHITFWCLGGISLGTCLQSSCKWGQAIGT